jgi:hypothetical protein
MFSCEDRKKDYPYIFEHYAIIDYEGISIILCPEKPLSGFKTQNRASTFQNPKLCAIFAA